MTMTTAPEPTDIAMDDTFSPPPEEQIPNKESSLKEITLKFTFKVKKSEKADPAQMHRNILTNIEDIDEHSNFFDQHNNTFSPVKTTNFTSKFTYKTFPRKHFNLICVAHKLKLHASLNNLKREMHNVLAANHASITVHTWSTLDTRDVGWLLQMHPRFHNRQDIKEQLLKLLATVNNNNNEIPKFQLYVKTINDKNANSAQRASAQAIVIESESNNVHNLRELLHTAYNNKSKSLPGKFIPINYQHIETKEKYSSLIRLQHQYLQDHRNISISGENKDNLEKIIHLNNNFDTIINHIKTSTVITWISPSISSSEVWNLSTNSSSFIASCNMVKTILDKVKELSSNIPSVQYPIKQSTSLTTTTKTYLDALNAFIPSHAIIHQPSNNSPKPSTSAPTNTSSPTNTISTTTQNSSVSSLTPTKDSIALSNMKEHLTKSISILRKEMKSIQDSLQAEIKDHLSQITESLLTTNNQEDQLPSSRIQDSISSLRNEFDQFRHAIRQELKDQLLLTVTEVVQTTTTQILTIITKEVHRALQTHLHALSPRNRKPKRSRAPNIDDPIQQQLFSDDLQDDPQQKTSINLDEQYEAANSLFEANMTIRPTSPPAYFSDMEDDNTNQP